MRWIFVAVGLVGSAAGAFASSGDWIVGQEREVEAGRYAKLLYDDGPWRLWRFETRSGHSCVLTQPSRGEAKPVPLGVRNYLFGGTPRLELSVRSGRVTDIGVSGRYSDGRAEYRMPGERYWTPWGSGPRDALNQRGEVELHTQSWEYPEIFVGGEDEQGVVTFAGLDEALAAGSGC